MASEWYELKAQVLAWFAVSVASSQSCSSDSGWRTVGAKGKILTALNCSLLHCSGSQIAEAGAAEVAEVLAFVEGVDDDVVVPEEAAEGGVVEVEGAALGGDAQ